MFETPLEKAINRGLRDGGDLLHEIYELDDRSVKLRRDARAIVAALDRLLAETLRPDDARIRPLIGLFQEVDSGEAFDVLAAEGMDRLVRIFELVLPAATKEADHDILFLLKIGVLYKDERAVDMLVRTARKSDGPDGYMWSVVFGGLDDEHPLWRDVCEALRDPLPMGYIAVAYLDFVNGHAIDGDLEGHPFDSPQGRGMLRTWLLGDDPDEYSKARSATVALPFISEPGRSELMALAMDHADAKVQLEASWAAAKLGREAGLKMLARFAEDPHQSATACHYLEELGKGDWIPKAAKEPDFRALADFCRWLAHPMEFGRAPDAIELFDKRELYWPPTDDRRPVWLFKYTYKGEGGAADDIGVGMVGSITFALFGDTTHNMTPEEIYGLHCCWELENNEDRRAPEQHDGETGWRIILEHQSL